MKPKNLIVFDMDGVIMDVSASYRDVVRRTAKLFFRPARDSENLPEPLFELSDLAAVKQSGGLNNDWDLTFVVINLLFTLVDDLKVYEGRDPWTRYGQTMRQCNVARLAGFLASTDHPLKSLLNQWGKQENPFIAGLYGGDVGSGNIIKQIFQEIYLGPELFKSTYHMEPEIYRGEGYILREKLLIDRSILEGLSQENLLAVATGRPQTRGGISIETFSIKTIFQGGVNPGRLCQRRKTNLRGRRQIRFIEQARSFHAGCHCGRSPGCRQRLFLHRGYAR